MKHTALYKDCARLNVVNYWAERGVKLVSDFAGTLLEKALPQITLHRLLKKKTRRLPQFAKEKTNQIIKVTFHKSNYILFSAIYIAN